MAIPELEDLARQVAELKRRVQHLESSPQVGNSSIRGGTLYVLDDDLGVVVAMGEVGSGGGVVADDPGFYVRSPDVAGPPWVWASKTDGLLQPYMPWDGWRPPSDFSAVTAGSWTTVWQVTAELVSCAYLKLAIPAVVDVGTTGELRLYISTTAQASSVFSLTSGFSATPGLYWKHPLTLASGPITFQVQAQRLTGGGNLNIFRPHPLTFGNFQPYSSTAGAWI